MSVPRPLSAVTPSSGPLNVAASNSLGVIARPQRQFQISPLFAPADNSAMFDGAQLADVPPLFSLLEAERLPLHDLIASMPASAAYEWACNDPPRTVRPASSSESTTNSGGSPAPEDDVSVTVQWGTSSEESTTPHESPQRSERGERFSTRTAGRAPKVTVSTVVPGPPPVELPSTLAGADINAPPPNWLSHDLVHKLHLSNPFWNPVSSAFSMVDMVASLMEEGRPMGDTVNLKNMHEWELPPHHSFFCDGPPDVVCPADQLKKILMSHVNGGPLAFVAHRIGPSVVIEGNPRQGIGTVREARSKSLKSKMMYFSILADESPASTKPPTDESPAHLSARSRSAPPAAAPPAGLEGGAASHFRKSLHWKFDDISVLLGVNTPTITCPPSDRELTLQMVDVSQHSHRKKGTQASQAIFTREEALDVWLDTIMANVDGVALCFHSDGVVQGCQVVSAAEIPHLTDDPFEPLAIQQEARNVLRWLTSACSKNGGSYVVLRDPNGPILRLYDISSFCDAAQGSPTKANATTEPSDGTPMLKAKSGTAEVQSLQCIDEDASAVFQKGKRKRNESVFRAFAFPLAMMCLRMAQALPNSDAETLRLLQRVITLLDDGHIVRDLGSAPDPSVFPLAKAYQLCMLHFHSSSPLQEAEKLSITHAQRSMSFCRVLWSNFRHNFTNDTSSFDDDRSRQLFRAQLIETDGIVYEVVRCSCALAMQKLKLRRYADVIEALAICQEGLWLRGLRPSLELHSPSLEESDHHRILVSLSPAESTQRRATENRATVFQLHSIVGDFLYSIASDFAHESKGCTEEGKSFVAKLNTDMRLNVATSQTVFEAGCCFDFIGKLFPLEADYIALLNGATDSFRLALQHSEKLGAGARDLHRKAAGVLVLCANTLAARPLAQVRDPIGHLLRTAAMFHEAGSDFWDVGDYTNYLMMSVNEGKMYLRVTQLEGVEGQQPITEWRCIGGALGCIARTISQVEDVTTTDTEQTTLNVTRSTFANVCLMAIERSTSSPQHFAKFAAVISPRLAEFVDRGAAGLAVLTNEVPELACYCEGDASQECNVTGAVLKAGEHAVNELLITPAVKAAKKANAVSLELHTLRVAYTFHRRLASVTDPIAQPNEWHGKGLSEYFSDAHVVESCRFFIARCRQYEARLYAAASSLASFPVDALTVVNDMCDGYRFLLKFSKELFASQHKHIEGEGETFTSQGREEAEIEIVERAVTAVVSTRPILLQLLRDPQLAPEGLILPRVRGVMSAAAAVTLFLLKLVTADKKKSESLRAVAKRSMMLTSSELKACLKEGSEVLEELSGIFEGKRRKQTSKYL